jgi:hypothetical protein
VTVCGGVADDDSVVCLDDLPKKEEKIKTVDEIVYVILDD